MIPDLKGEIAHFAKNPFAPSEKLNFETIIEIIPFNDETKSADLGDGVILKRYAKTW